MADLVGGVLLLLCGVLVFASVGHGLWLLISKVMALVFGNRCPNCDQAYLGAHACRESLPRPSLRADLIAMQRVLGHPISTNQLGVATTARLQEFVRDSLVSSPGKSTGTELRKAAPPAQPRVLSCNDDTDDAVVVARLLPQKATETESKLLDEGVLEPSSKRPEPSPVEQMHPLDQPESAFDSKRVLSGDLVAAPAAAETDAVVVDCQQPAVQRPIRQQWTATIVARFMEQANVRWVELISAMLVVGCSIGLVVSLWHTLSETTRFFPSLVFLVSTVAVHFAGRYTLSMWNLRSTSRGILHISIMLIPLSVLVGLLLARRDTPPPLDVTFAATVALAVSCYGYLSVSAARMLSCRYWKPMTLSVITAGLTLLAIDYFAQNASLHQEYATLCSMLPIVIVTVVSATLMLVRITSRVSFPDYAARELTGAATQVLFATAVPFIFYIMQRGYVPNLVFWGGITIASGGWLAFSGVLVSRLSLLRGGSPTWLTVASWGLFAISVSLLAVSILQLPRDTTTLCLLTTGGGLYLSGIAYKAGLRRVFVAGSTCLLLGASTIPAVVRGSAPILDYSWVSLESILSLTAVGIAAYAVVLLIRSADKPRANGRRLGLTGFAQQFSATTFCDQLQISGGIVLSLAGLLTILASFVSSESYWATPLLAIAGWPLLIASLLWNHHAGRLAPSVAASSSLSCALVLTAISTIQAIMLGDWLNPLLGERSGPSLLAISLVALSLAWALLSSIAVNARKVTVPVSEALARVVASFSVMFGIAALVLLSSSDSSLVQLSHWGWFAAVAGLLTTTVSLNRDMMRGSIVALCVWLCIFVHHQGAAETLAPFGALGYLAIQSFVAMAVIVLIRPIAFAGLSRLSRFADGHVVNRPSADWDVALIAWGTVVGLGALLSACFMDRVAAGLVATEAELLERLGPFTLLNASTTLAAVVVALSLLCRFQSLRASINAVAIGLFPILFAESVALAADPGAALVVFCWTLAVGLVASEAFCWHPSMGSFSSSIWAAIFSVGQKPLPLDGLVGSSFLIRCVAVHRLGSIVLLIFATGFAVLQIFLPEILVEPGTRLLVLVPALVVLLVRWIVLHFDFDRQALGTAGDVPQYIPGLFPLGGSIAAFFVGATWLYLVDEGAIYLFPRLPLALATSLAVLVCSSRLLRWRNDRITGAVQRSFEKECRRLLWPATIAWALLISLAGCFAIMLPAGRPPGSEFFVSWPLIIGAVVQTVALVGQLLHESRRSSENGVASPWAGDWLAAGAKYVGLLVGPLAAAAVGSILVQYSADHSISTEQWFLPGHVLVGVWGICSVVLSLQSWKRIREIDSDGAAVRPKQTLRFVLMNVVGWYAIAGIAVDPVSWFPPTVLGSIAVLLVFEAAVCRAVIGDHVAAVLAAAAILPLIRTSVGAYQFDESLVMVLWGPIGVSFLSLLAGHLLPKLPQFAGDLPIGPSPDNGANQLSVAATTSTLISVCLLPLSFIACLWRAPDVNWPDLLSIQLGAIVIAIARCFVAREQRRSASVYLGLMGVSLWGAVAIARTVDLAVLESLLLWSTAVLTSMSFIGFAIKELVQSCGLLTRVFASADAGRQSALRLASAIAPVHLVAAVLSVVPAVCITLAAPDQSLRIMATSLPLVALTTLVSLLLIRNSLEHEGFAFPGNASSLRPAMVCLGGMTFFLTWWVDLPRIVDASWPELWIYAQRAMLSFTTMMVVSHVVVRWKAAIGPWRALARISEKFCLAMALAMGIGLTVLQFTSQWEQSAVAATLQAKIFTLLAWLFLAAKLAVLASRVATEDAPITLGARKALFYGFELCLLGFSFSLYSHFPELLGGLISQWWPLVVFAAALISGSLGGLISRTERGVSSQMKAMGAVVDRNSLLLPIIPLVGVWLLPSGAVWTQWSTFAGLLLCGSITYILQSLRLRSVPLGIVGGILVFSSYWVALHGIDSMRFRQHPQFWLLPPCLFTLLAVHRLRERLPASTVGGVRYAALVIAYTSSTSEVFFEAMGGTLWQALTLLILALLGVTIGIAARVQSFLYCGASFTFLAVLGMVLNAQRAIGGVWPWWAFGIVTGVALIVLLGYFEKNRQEILDRLTRVQTWKA